METTQKLHPTYECPICTHQTKAKDFIGGVCKSCDKEGFWIDPAGGVHYPGEEDPTSIYE